MSLIGSGTLCILEDVIRTFFGPRANWQYLGETIEFGNHCVWHTLSRHSLGGDEWGMSSHILVSNHVASVLAK